MYNSTPLAREFSGSTTPSFFLFETLTSLHYELGDQPENELQKINYSLNEELLLMINTYPSKHVLQLKQHLGEYASDLASSLSTYITFPSLNQSSTAADYLNHYDLVSNYFLERVTHHTKSLTHPTLLHFLEKTPESLQSLTLNTLNTLLREGFHPSQIHDFLYPLLERHTTSCTTLNKLHGYTSPNQSPYISSYDKILKITLKSLL